MSKQIDPTRHTVRHNSYRILHHADQPGAQEPLRYAFPFGDPPPLPEEVEEARERCAGYDRESNLGVIVGILCIVAFLCFAAWVGWHVSDLAGVGK